MNENYKIINETDFNEYVSFPSNKFFNGIYLYRGKYAIAEFNQKFAGSIILKSKYYETIDDCINSYNILNDIYFSKTIIKYNLS